MTWADGGLAHDCGRQYDSPEEVEELVFLEGRLHWGLNRELHER